MLNWFTYILLCKNNTYYTGITNNLEKRIKAHNAGKGAAYTRGRHPVKLLYSEKFSNHSEAAKRECQIKKLNRVKKEELINRKS